MRRYHLFTKPARVADVIEADQDANVSEVWQQKAEKLQKRRWRRMRNKDRFFKKVKPWHDNKVAWDA